MDGLGQETVDSLGTTAEDLVAIGRLLDSPRLAHIWFTLHQRGNIVVEQSSVSGFGWDGLTVSKLNEHLVDGIPQSTLYTDMEELVDVGAVRIESEGQPVGYSANFFQADAENVDEVSEDGIIGPQIIGLVGQAFTDDNVEQFIETYGHSKLTAAYKAYARILREDTEQELVEMFPSTEVNNDDLTDLVPAIERVMLALSRDPNWGEDFSETLAQ